MLRICGLLVVLLVQEVWMSPTFVGEARDWTFEDDPRYKCLGKFGFPEGTEERIFRIVMCTPQHPIVVECSDRMMQRMSNFSKVYHKRKFDQIPEDFSHFLGGISRMWWIIFREIHTSARCEGKHDGPVCWDFFPMLKTVMEFDALNRYFVWISAYATPFIILVVLFGLLANALVIAVIIRFKEMRTQPNMIILNLAVSDTLLLINYGVLFTLMYLMPVTMVLRGFCKTLLYLTTFCSTCSVYSVMTLSLLRYLAISAVPGSQALLILQQYLSIPVVIVAVWLVSAVASVPFMLDINDNCVPYFDPVLQTLGTLLFCVLPLAAMVTSTYASRNKLKSSIEEVPGNWCPKTEWARERGANTILVLCSIFVVTLVPPTVIIFISSFTEVTSLIYLQAVVRQMLIFLNTCINPVAVFVSSETFRNHLKLLLPFRLAGYKPAPLKEVTTSKSEMK